jgi:HD-like signal output (HDOD) protein
MLKLANSAGYMTVTRVETIEEAATIIGSKGINALLVASGVHDIFDKRYKRFELIWKDSEKRAFYAQKISIQLKYNKLSEYAYLSALLADLGLIIINSLNPEIMQRLKEITGYKGIEDTSLIEEISLGISHSSIGASIARKWKFNEALTHAIEFHHRPYVAPEEYQELIYIVYLADAFVEIDKGKMKFSTLDEDVLKYFRLEEKPEFDRLHQTLIKALEKQHEETAAT